VTLEFALTEEQEAIRRLAHEFAEREIRPVAAQFDESEEFPYEVVKKAHRLGLSPAAFLPEEYGGQGLDFLTELILNEELSWGCAGIAVCIQSMALAMAGIRSSGTEEQKKRWLPEFTNPDRLVLGGQDGLVVGHQLYDLRLSGGARSAVLYERSSLIQGSPGQRQQRVRGRLHEPGVEPVVDHVRAVILDELCEALRDFDLLRLERVWIWIGGGAVDRRHEHLPFVAVRRVLDQHARCQVERDRLLAALEVVLRHDQLAATGYLAAPTRAEEQPAQREAQDAQQTPADSHPPPRIVHRASRAQRVRS